MKQSWFNLISIKYAKQYYFETNLSNYFNMQRRPIGRGTKLYNQKQTNTKNLQQPQPNSDETQINKSYTQNRQPDEEEKQAASYSQTTLTIQPKRKALGGTYASESSNESQSSEIRIGFDENDNITPSYRNRNHLSSKLQDGGALSTSTLNRQERKQAIDSHRHHLSQYPITSRDGSRPYQPYNANNWQYDEDEENTPTLQKVSESTIASNLIGRSTPGIELKAMSYGQAAGHGYQTTRESPLQNHFISNMTSGLSDHNTAYHQSYSNLNQSQPSNKFITLDKSRSNQFDEMFEQAEKNKTVMPRNDPKISMQHALADEDTYTGNRGKYKSRIGGTIGSKKDNDSPGELLNDDASKTFQQYMESKAQEAQNRTELGTPAKFGAAYMKGKQLAQTERKNNKLSNQIKKDDNVDEEKDAMQSIQKQIQVRQERKKKEQEEEAWAVYENQVPVNYQTGDGIGRLASSMFTAEGRKEKELESQDIRSQDLKELMLNSSYDDELTQYNKEKRKINQDIKVKTDSYNAELEEMKYQLQSNTETIHPSKYKKGTSQITDVRQNMFKVMSTDSKVERDKKDLSSSNYLNISQNSESRGVGVTGSSLGFGIGQAGFQSTSTKVPVPAHSSLDQSRVGNSQFKYHNTYKDPNLSYNHSQSYIGFQESYGNVHHLNQAQLSSKQSYQGMYPNQSYGSGSSTSRMTSTYNYQPATATSSYGSHTPQYGQTSGAKQQFTASSQNQYGKSSVPQTKGYFYESQSKYISLKRFSEDLQFQNFTSSNASNSNDANNGGSKAASQQVVSIYQNQGNSKQQKNMKQEHSLQSWFHKLLGYEKCIVLTIVDPDLVNLVKAMHSQYAEYGHGCFTPNFPGEVGRHPRESDRYVKLKDYNLLFKKPGNTGPSQGFSSQRYDSYGYLAAPQDSFASNKTVRQLQEVEDTLISNINIIKIGDAEALTINNEMLENSTYFCHMMQQVDPKFLLSELKIEKTEATVALQTSVLAPHLSGSSGLASGKGDDKTNQEQTAHSRKATGRGGHHGHQRDQDVFFTLNERDLSTSQLKTGTGSDNFRDRTSLYNSQRTKAHPNNQQQDKEVILDKTRLSLGRILSHLFEKAINVQYQDFQNKLSNPMKEFFYTQTENHLYQQDLSIAKFWKELKQKEQDKIWNKVQEAQEEVINEIKNTDSFKKHDYEQLEVVEDVSEPEGTGTDSDTSLSHNLKFNQRRQGKRGKIFERSGSRSSKGLSEVNESRSQSDNSDDNRWGSPHQREMNNIQAKLDKNKRALKSSIQENEKKINQQTKRLQKNYVTWGEPEEDCDLPNPSGCEVDSNDTDSDDIEKNNNYKQGYRPIPSGPSSSKHSTTKLPPIEQLRGRGIGALDFDNTGSSDATVSEDSGDFEDAERDNSQKYRAIRGIDNTYNGGDRMKSIYSTKVDKEWSEGEIEDFQNCQYPGLDIGSQKYASDYDQDQFEDQEEEDPDDDFNLPRNHEQIVKPNDPYANVMSIKQKIEEQQMQKKQLAARNQPRLTQEPQYQSTASQADVGSKDKASKVAAKKTPKKSKLASQQKEEEKTKSTDRQSLLKTKQQTAQNKETIKEQKLRQQIKKDIELLQLASSKALGAHDHSSSSIGEVGEISNCYMFIRKLSTYSSPSFLEKVQGGHLSEVAKLKMLQRIHTIFESEKQERTTKLLEDLMDDEPPNKKTKASSDAQSAQTAAGSASKAAGGTKKKKKSKADKGQANKDAAAGKAQEENKERTKIELTLNDDLVIITDKKTTEAEEKKTEDDAAQNADTTEAEKEAGKKKKKNKKRKQKKDKKKNEGEPEAKVDPELSDNLEKAPSPEAFHPGQKKEPEALQDNKDKDSESEMGSSITGKVEEMKLLIQKDQKLRVYEEEIKTLARKEFLADSKGYSDSISNMSNFSNTNSKGGSNSASKDKDDYLPLGGIQKYKAERTSLLHGLVQYDKYPEAIPQTHAVDMTKNHDFYTNLSKDDENLFENCEKDEAGQLSSAYYDNLTQGLDEDSKMLHHTDFGLRRRNESEINLAKKKLANALREDEGKKKQRQLHEREREELMRREIIHQNQQLLSGLDDLNTICRDETDQIAYSQRQKVGMRMVDIKQQREKQHREYHQSQKDYQEKAIDMDKEEKGDEAAADDEAQETKKKKKKRKNKKKKKNMENQEGAEPSGATAEFPDRIVDIALQINKEGGQKGQVDGFEWQQQLDKELQNEKRSDDGELDQSSPKSKQSNAMEINTYFNDHYYLDEGKVDDDKYKNPHANNNNDQEILSLGTIALEFRDDEAQNQNSKTKNQNAPLPFDWQQCKAKAFANEEEDSEMAKAPATPAVGKLSSATIQTQSSKADKVSSSLQGQKSTASNLKIKHMKDQNDIENTTNYVVDMAKKMVQDCVLNQPDQKNKNTAQSLPNNSQDKNLAQKSSQEITSDPVIRLDEEQTTLLEPEYTHQQAPTMSSKKQAKLEKKKQAKQNAKLKEQQMKQKETEIKEERARQRKEMQQQKLLNKNIEEAQQQDDDNLQIQSVHQQITLQKDVKLPGLDALNGDGKGSPPQASSLVRTQLSKKVKFQRDTSYDGSAKVPKRGSSRGTSMASSNKNKDDEILTDLDELFAKEYKKPQQSIIDSLNNSKKNSPENTTNKSNTDKDSSMLNNLNDQILQKKLEDFSKQAEHDSHRLSPSNVSISGGVRSSSVPTDKQTKSKHKGKKELWKNQTTANIHKVEEGDGGDYKEVKPSRKADDGNGQSHVAKQTLPSQTTSKKAQAKQLHKEAQYAQIQAQPSIPIIKPEPKLSAKQRKKLLKEKEAQNLLAVEKAAAKTDARASVSPRITQNAEETKATASIDKVKGSEQSQKKSTANQQQKRDKSEERKPSQPKVDFIKAFDDSQMQVKNQNKKGKKQLEEAKGVTLLNSGAATATGVGSKKQPTGKKEKKEDMILQSEQAFPPLGQSTPLPQQNQMAASAVTGNHRKPYLQPTSTNQTKGKVVQQNVSTKQRQNPNSSSLHDPSDSPQSEDNGRASNPIDAYNQNQGFIVQRQPQLSSQNNNQIDLSGHQSNISHLNHTGQNLNSQNSQPHFIPQQDQTQVSTQISVDIIRFTVQQNQIPVNTNSSQQNQNQNQSSNQSAGANVTQLVPQQQQQKQNTNNQQSLQNQWTPNSGNNNLNNAQNTNQYFLPNQQQFAQYAQANQMPQGFTFNNMQVGQGNYNFNGLNNFQNSMANMSNMPNFMGFGPMGYANGSQGSNGSGVGQLLPNSNQLNAMQNMLPQNNGQMNNVQSQLSGFNPNQNFTSNHPMNPYMMANMNNHYNQGAMGAGFQQQMPQPNQNAIFNQMNFGGSGVPSQSNLQSQGQNNQNNSQQQQMNMYNQFVFQQYLNQQQQNQFNSSTQQRLSPPTGGVNNTQGHQPGANGNSNFYPSQQNQLYQQMQQAQQQQFMKSQQMNPNNTWNKPEKNQNSRTSMAQSNQDSRQGGSGQKPAQKLTPVKIADQIPNANLRVNPIDMYVEGVQNVGSSTSPNQFQPGSFQPQQTSSYNQFNQNFQQSPQNMYQKPMPPQPLGVSGDLMQSNNYKPQSLNDQSGVFIPASQQRQPGGNQPFYGFNAQNGQMINQPLYNQYDLNNMYINQQVNYNQKAESMQKMAALAQLQSQGYLDEPPEWSPFHNGLATLELQELSFVPEFYEVLDAQIVKLKQDQEMKLLKTQKLRQIAFELIRDKIKEVYREKQKTQHGDDKETVKIDMYGSMATGLAIDSSDLDILVHDFINQDSPRFHQMNRQELIEEMQMLHQALNSVFALKTNTLIQTASVPVIKLEINLTKIQERENENKNLKTDAFQDILEEECRVLNIDITLDEPKKHEKSSDETSHEHLGLQCCKYIKQKLEEYPEMKTLALIFKKFLSLKNLNKPFSGGLSSYSLIQMILAVLKTREQSGQQTGQTKDSQHNIGKIFRQFLWEYGFVFQPLEKGIALDCQIVDKSQLMYILHSRTCNINQNKTEGEEEIIDGHVCTCGLYANAKKMSTNDGVGGGPSHPGTGPQGQLMALLQKLVNNQNQDDLDEDPRGRSMPIHFNQPQLIIADPLNKFNNIGKSSYNFAAIQEELRAVHGRLDLELATFVRARAHGQQTPEEERQNLEDLIPRILGIEYQHQYPTIHQYTEAQNGEAEESKASQEPAKMKSSPPRTEDKEEPKSQPTPAPPTKAPKSKTKKKEANAQKQAGTKQSQKGGPTAKAGKK